MKKPKIIEKLETKEKYLVDFKELKGNQPEKVIDAVYKVTGVFQPVNQVVQTTKDGSKEVAVSYLRYELTKDNYVEVRKILGANDIEIPEWPSD